MSFGDSFVLSLDVDVDLYLFGDFDFDFDFDFDLFGIFSNKFISSSSFSNGLSTLDLTFFMNSLVIL